MTFGDSDIYSKLIFGSPEPVFLEYMLLPEKSFGIKATDKNIEKRTSDAGYELIYEENVRNEIYIKEIQKGESDFVREYIKRFRDYETVRNISLSNARKPFEDAIKHDKHYIDMVFADCIFDEDKT